MARVRHEQDDAGDTQIALLGSDRSFERLDVVEVGLGLDEDVEPIALDEGVAASMVARDRDRDLRSPSKSWAKPLVQPVQEGEVAAISDRIPVGVQPDAELQAEDSGQACDKVDRQDARLPAECPLDRARADAEPPSQLAKAEPTRKAGIVELGRGPRSKLTTSPGTAFGG